MKRSLIAALLVLTVGLSGVAQALPARADAPPAGASLGGSDDLAIALVDMLGNAADCLAAYQDQVANEAYLGSAAPTRRLRTAVSWAPSQVIVPARAAEPVAACTILIRRDD